MYQSKKEKLNRLALVVGSGVAVAAGSASAAIDTTAVLSTIADVVTAGAAVGGAALAMHFSIKAFKWIRTAA